MARIRAILRRVCPGETNSFKLKDLSVFPKTLIAKREEEIIDLSPREVKMLELLKKNEGSPVTRDAFLDSCWGTDYFPDSRTLDQHISVLRKKIELNPAHPSIIKTVRSIGYRFG